MREGILSQLECFNDPNFIFDPKKHKYTYHGETFQSVTQFIQQFKPPFDSDYWSKIKAEERGIPQEEILLEWKYLNNKSTDIGNSIHDWIEKYFKGEYQQLPPNLEKIDRINKFNVIYATHLYKLEPVKFEVRIFSKKWKLAGTIDSIFLYRGKIFILDWKSNKHDFDNPKVFNNLLHPFNDLGQTHINEYSIQISLYALILEEWGFDVGGGYLVHIGPNTEAKIYKIVDLRETLKTYLDLYKAPIKSNPVNVI